MARSTGGSSLRRSTVVDVDCTGRVDAAFETVAAALQSCEGGGSIRIHPGVYKEGTLVIDKPIEICGECAGDVGKVSTGVRAWPPRSSEASAGI